MGLLGNVITGVVASRMAGRGGMAGGLGGAMLGGMGRGRGSPVARALMLILAAKAAQSYMQQRRSGAQAGPSGSVPGGQGGLGGLLSGVAGGAGLGALVEQFRRTGHGDALDSWIGSGPNQKLPPRQLAQALGPDTVSALSAETGLEEDVLLEELSDTLPEAVDQLSPDGVPPDPAVLDGDDEDTAVIRASAV
jgi:uncharacterized protein YidB (DUF937 family)